MPAVQDHERFEEYATLSDHIVALADHLKPTRSADAIRLLINCGSNHNVRGVYRDALLTMGAAEELERDTNGNSSAVLAEILMVTAQILGKLEGSG